MRGRLRPAEGYRMLRMKGLSYGDDFSPPMMLRHAWTFLRPGHLASFACEEAMIIDAHGRKSR